MISYLDTKRHNKYKKNLKYTNYILRHGNFGIKACTDGLLKHSVVEELNNSLTKKIKFLMKGKHNIKWWSLIKLTSNLTKLSPESRMGKGKGNIFTKFSWIQPGQIIFEFDNISKYNLIAIHQFLKIKLPFQIVIVYR